MVRIRAGALTVMAIVLAGNVAASSAGARQASGTGGGETSTVIYSGTLQNTVQLVDSSGHVSEILSQDYTWKATWSGPTNLISDQSGKTLGWTSVSLSGSDSIQYPDSNQGPGQSQNCADSLSVAPGQTFNAVLPAGGDAITFALHTISPRQTPTQGGGCFMSARLACPPGSVPNEQNGTYCNPGPAWKFMAGAKTFTISSSYGPTNVGGKIVTSRLTSNVSASGAGCPLSSSPGGLADRAHLDPAHATVAQALTLHIEDLIHGGNIEKTTQRVATGSRVRLTVACGLGPPDRDSVQWTITGLTGRATTSSAIKRVPPKVVLVRVPEVHGGAVGRTTVVHLGNPPEAVSRRRDLSSPNVDFYFIQPGKWQVKVKARYNGRSLSASVTYYVIKPNPGIEALRFGVPRTYTTQGGYRLGLTGLDPTDQTVGLRYSYKPSINRPVGPVSYALFQLITVSERGTGFPTVHVGPALDTCAYQTLALPFRSAFVTANSPGTAMLSFTDGPNMTLTGPFAGGLSQGPNSRAQLNVTLDTFLLVVPVGGVPVALGDTRMNFVARARKIGHIWFTIPQPRPTFRTTIYPNRVRFVPGWPPAVFKSQGIGCVANPLKPPNG